jgi:hypothetical protein
MKLCTRSIFGAALLAFAGTSASATILYDNSSNYLGTSYSPGNSVEFGDEISLSGGPNISFTDFAFETFVGANANGNESVKIRLLLNDGPEVSPGAFAPQTQLYASGAIPLGKDFQATTISGISVSLPAGVNHLTWTAEFSGIDPNEQVGLPLYHPPTIGDSFTDFWKNDNGTWGTFLLSTPASFGARISVSDARVPDAGPTALLALLAGAAIVGLRRYYREDSAGS